MTTDYTGAVQRTEGVLMGPFGDGFSETASLFTDFTGFAAGMWDAENNSDHFGAREYAKTQGRWMTPDPAGLAAVDPTDPQSWNRYAYVMNNPTSYVDPTGLFLVDCIWEACPHDNSGGGGGGDYGGGSPMDGYMPTVGLLGKNDTAGESGWYQNMVDDAFNGTNYTGDATTGGPGYNIWVYCSGQTLLDVTCQPPSQAVFGSSAIRANFWFPGLAPGDVPVGDDFINCRPGCTKTWQNANQIADPRTITLWYGASAIEGLLLVPSAGQAAGSSIYNTWLSFEHAFPGATADVLQMLTPPQSIPSTLPGVMVVVGEELYDWFKE